MVFKLVKKSCRNCLHFGGCDKLCLETRKMWEPRMGIIADSHAVVDMGRRRQKEKGS